MASLSEQAYEKLRQLVLKAEPGTFLSVRKCAKELDFSYTPMREALLRLYSEGLLDLVPSVGFFTAQMNLRDITDIYQGRDCIEQYVLPLVIPHLTKSDKEFLDVRIAQQEKALEKGDIEQYSEADFEFHCYLINLLNNRRLKEFYENICHQYRVASNAVTMEYGKLPIEEHREFMRLIENGEYGRAVEIMHTHVKDAIKRMQEGFVRIGM